MSYFLQVIVPKLEWFFFENPLGIAFFVVSGIIGLTMFIPPIKKK